ncbi:MULTISPECIES: carboxypeptidase M32 [Listeria]|uniref:carboxypeptidase M32 n=1 Tax=Listeria TaxID=1637 RepID=UPI000B58CF4E|nr:MULTISPECIES: carboxypeptidase M32 [Listeria]
MSESIYEIEKEFLAYVKRKEALSEALNLVYWDIRTGIPKKGAEARAEVIGVLSEDIFKLEVSEEMAAFIAALTPHKDELGEVGRKTLEECSRLYELNKKIPAKEFAAYSKLVADAENVWGEARAENNFAKFEPLLTQIVAMKRKFIEYWGYKANKYDTLLEQYEPGMTVETLDAAFGKLRSGIMDLRKKMEQGEVPSSKPLQVNIAKDIQKTFSERILQKMGFDFDAGRLDDTIHPFAIGLNVNDVRITTRYAEDNFKMAVFGIIHEGGHAIYEQNFDPKLSGTPLSEGASMGIHESQSLFYEIILGSSFAFWKSNFKDLAELAKPVFDAVSLEDFYRATNISESSLIRIEADILTYPLHIMIRYELEKALMNGELEVADLREAWANKYEAYLGVRPEKDSDGVLQDIHWAGGDFGYFPSYALGLMYAAQFFHTMKREIPNLDAIIASDDYTEIRKWLTKNVHQYGKLKKPLEILQDTTGESLNPDYLLDLLNERYKFVYKF